MRNALVALALAGSCLCLGATAAAAEPSVQPAQSQSSGAQEKKGNCFATYRTKQSRVQLCKVSGQVYYRGSSGAGSITLPAHRISAGTYETEENDGHVYTINSEELVITRDGEVISEQPVISKKKNKSTTRKPSSKTPRDEGSFSYQAPGTSCVQKGNTTTCTTPYGSYSYSYQR